MSEGQASDGKAQSRETTEEPRSEIEASPSAKSGVEALGEAFSGAIGGALEQITEVGEGLGSQLKSAVSGAVRQSAWSNAPVSQAYTDKESFKQFLFQVMKANLGSQTDVDEEVDKLSMTNKTRSKKTSLAAALSGKIKRKIFCNLCPRTQRAVYQVCRCLVNNWIFNVFAMCCLLLHCVGLVEVADGADTLRSTWRGISFSYFGIFLMELTIRMIVNPRANMLDLLLLTLCLVEVFISLRGMGQGQFAALSLRWLHVVGGLCWPRESMATIAAFGPMPMGVMLMVCLVWTFLAVLWFMVLSTTNEEWTVPQYQDFGSSFLTQLYLASSGMNWRRITNELPGSVLSAIAMRFAFILVLIMVALVTGNAMIVLTYELAQHAHGEHEVRNEAELVRKRLFSLSGLEEKIMEATDGDAETFSRDQLEQVLPRAQEELREQGITQDEVLQLYDHLAEVSGSVMISDLLFGILLLTSPAGAADLLQVDHLQKQCIQITDAANSELHNLLKTGQAAVETMEDSILSLQAHTSKLRVQTRKASKEVREIMTEVEKQFEDCSRSVDNIADLRTMQLRQVHQRVRQNLYLRLGRAQTEVTKLEDYNRLSLAFGFPEGSEVIRKVLSAKGLLHPDESRPNRERQLQLAAALLRAEVKERFEQKMFEYFEEDERSVTSRV